MNHALVMLSVEWGVALLMICSVWLLTGRGGHAWLGLLLFAAALGSCGWLAWRVEHVGLMVQLLILSVLSLRGLLRGRGWKLK